MFQQATIRPRIYLSHLRLLCCGPLQGGGFVVVVIICCRDVFGPCFVLHVVLIDLSSFAIILLR